MKYYFRFEIFNVLVLILFYTSISVSQNNSSADEAGWKYNAEANFYFTDPFIIIPVLTADKDLVHLEARYNYEDLKTFSGWVGINISGGKKFQYSIVPMGGFILGRVTGFAPGLELDFSYWDLEFSSQSEYVFDTEDKENNFYYTWADLAYSPVDWLFFGLSAQRTKAYETDLDVQRGLLAGVSYKEMDISAYYYNPGLDTKFFLLTLSAGF